MDGTGAMSSYGRGLRDGLPFLMVVGPFGLAQSLALAATIAAGWYVAIAAWRAVRLRAADMNVLMCTAAAGAHLIGEPFEAATAMFLSDVCD